MSATADQRARNTEFWARAAPGWIRQADRHDRLGQPLGAAAMDWLAARPGERILDLGCGCGGTTAEIAAAVGPSGKAVGLDLAEPMVAHAAERFPASRHPGLHFVRADIESDDLIPGTPFDAVYSRMSLMLFAEPVAGCAALRRSLRPGARLAATVFRDGGTVAWLHAVMLGAAPHVGHLPPLPIGDEPGPFAFADADRVRRVLTAAGFEAITVQPHDVVLRAPDDPDLVAEWLIDIGPAGVAYREASTIAQATARASTAQLLERFRDPTSGYRFPTGLWLITATAQNRDRSKPGPLSTGRPSLNWRP